MDGDTLELIRRLDCDNLESQLVLQCAPLIAGLKKSNFLVIPTGYYSGLKLVLNNSQISDYVLMENNQTVSVLLYNKMAMTQYLMDWRVKKLLREMGYFDYGIEAVLAFFAYRYRSYKLGGQSFPHEMGILLGYPIEDVEGYIHNNGENFICSGYWKVYENPDYKVKLFRRFEYARDMMLHMIAQGVSILEIINRYSGSLQNSTF